MKTTINSTVAAPIAYVTKNRQRIKQHDNNTVYLKNGDEFEIELFNPQSFKVLAKIILNGKSIGSGIVLRPGERVFLERYLDKAQKFLFETYSVSGNNTEVEKAIQNNGTVEVKFYQEDFTHTLLQSLDNYPHIYYDNQLNHGNQFNTFGTCNNTGNATGITRSFFNSSVTTSNCSNVQPSSLSFTTSSTLGMDSLKDFAPQQTPSLQSQKKTKETGRIEAGSNSDQTFTYDSTRFTHWTTWTTTWKILPVSQKALVKEDLKVFCTECGARRKKDTHKFCPQCGSKL